MRYKNIYPVASYKRKPSDREELLKIEPGRVIEYYLRPNPWLTYRTKGRHGVALFKKVKITGVDNNGGLTGKLMLAYEKDNIWWRKNKTINLQHIDHIVLR